MCKSVALSFKTLHSKLWRQVILYLEIADASKAMHVKCNPLQRAILVSS